ncbi:ABC transporter substrate-binding protein [Modestobacter lapidis]|nr:ABC transporter substrate-binding protein [Modestobacter lapidis]
MQHFLTIRPGRTGRPLALAAVLALGLTLTACGGSSDDGAGASGDGDDATTSMSVGYFPLVHTASAVNAAEHGLFADEGLEVELTPTAGGAQAIPALVAGEFDIAYGNYTSAFLAAQQGLPLRLVAGNDVGGDDHSLLVAGNSPLQGPADLAGRRIAVNNLLNIGTVAINTLLEEAGVDPSSVTYVELPYPDMQAALERGDVDAIWQVEPFQASALAGGNRIVLPMFAGPTEGMPVAGWITTEQFVQENPEAVEAFQRALDASMTELQDDRARLVELVPTYTQVPAEVVEQVAMPTWSAELDTQRLQDIADLMLEYELIDEEFDVSTITGG